MPKAEVHTVIPSLSEAEHAESDPESVMTSKTFVVYTVYCVCLSMSICVLKEEFIFGLKADPGPASSSSRSRSRLFYSSHTNLICADSTYESGASIRMLPTPPTNTPNVWQKTSSVQTYPRRGTKSEDKHQLQTVQT